MVKFSGTGNGGSGLSTGMLIAGAVTLLALPSAVLAVSARFEPPPFAETQIKAETLEADSPRLRLARGMPLQSLTRGVLYPFTPAKNPNRPDRSVTVAVRIDPQAIGAIKRQPATTEAVAGLGLAQSAFTLGVARGYRNFAQAIGPSPAPRKIDGPDLTRFTLAPGSAPAGTRSESRFSPRVMDDRQTPGRAPHTFAGERDDQVDFGGSYRLTRNLNVTAGVRYSQDRERLRPLTDGKQDNQAVYLGTQIRF